MARPFFPPAGRRTTPRARLAWITWLIVAALYPVGLRHVQQGQAMQLGMYYRIVCTLREASEMCRSFAHLPRSVVHKLIKGLSLRLVPPAPANVF
jgi:hypothetical protein